ncbi:3'-5' exoribonuclease [Actinacidiphila sp. ITFR-21]|uniref:3'-5' exoribonuclease n=1 Tax=Actinacidiphila sp. ITFR-21 TaxID=3075199 RepID=UPI00288BAE3B|nr:3'-5' exoribonuclease [Streptomyces sp. ITFR-21]WNI16636.1 3'-5' exoribonuclease [Streptomyces sp. ITFR-21]
MDELLTDRHTPTGTAPTSTIRHVYIDTEFLRHNLTSRGLVSLALTDDDGTDYYAVNRGMDTTAVHADPWMRENVWPYLPLNPRGVLDLHGTEVRPYPTIRDEVSAYFADTTAATTYLYANHGAQDIVRLHGLWDHDWAVMPTMIPRWFYDTKGLAAAAGNPELPAMEHGAHHPLEDARHNRTVRLFLAARSAAGSTPEGG